MDLMELRAKITLDSDEYEREASTLTSNASKTFSGIAKGVGIAVGAASTAVVALTKQSIDSYKEFEQLEGGIETLYGSSADAVEKMLENADNAWKTSGLSANEYMETAISSSAAMISALGGDADAAAELMDMSIIDMSDNVNKMGTSMESIQNAYRGFSRGNFTMLDNLALGYAGTKEGMQQLLDKATELEAQQGRTTQFSIDSYADIVRAIHIVQDEMGITGTTYEEAQETISGSINAMKSAWTNLVTGLADDNADLSQLIDNFITSVVGENGEGGVINNLMPAIQQALDGIIQLITEVAPTLIPMAVELIIEHLPEIIEAGVQILAALVTGLTEAIPQLIAAIPEIVTSVVNALKDGWPEIKQSGIELLERLREGIISALQSLLSVLQLVLTGIKNNLTNAWNEAKEDAIAKWDAIKSAVLLVGETLATDISTTWESIKTAASEIWTGIQTTIGDIVSEIQTTITGAWNEITTAVSDKMAELWNTAIDKFLGIYHTISGWIETIKGLFKFEWSWPHLKLPHITYDLIDVPLLGTIPNPTTLAVEWYKKAYESPYMFTKPTVVGALGFGDGNGGEMVYGHQNLLNDIKEAMRSVAGDDRSIVVQCVLDGRVISETVTKYQRREARAFG